ncbi:MAG TPA: YceI family protein [Chitinophagaceae bacterium]|nr:YceI family protein [Chitinophagaceae bacterium]
MKKGLLLAAGLMMGILAFSQERVFTKKGQISFYSKAPLEDIEAHNKAAVSVLDKTTGQVECSVLMKGFEFEKALQQEHFNENYVESDKYPKAVFRGKLADVSKVKFGADGSYTVPVSGQLTLHGETKDVSANATLTVKGGALSGHTEFSIVLEDYKIKIPALVKDKISKTVKIVMDANYESMK